MKDKGGVCEYYFCNSTLIGKPSEKKVHSFKEIQRRFRILCLHLCFQALLVVKMSAADVSVCVIVVLFVTRETAGISPELQAAGAFSSLNVSFSPSLL